MGKMIFESTHHAISDSNDNNDWRAQIAMKTSVIAAEALIDCHYTAG